MIPWSLKFNQKDECKSIMLQKHHDALSHQVERSADEINPIAGSDIDHEERRGCARDRDNAHGSVHFMPPCM
jgi:hypothetical protein